MAINNFIPTIWSARLLENLNNSHVFASLANRDYEGEITAVGDSVKINSIGRVTIGSYTKNTDMNAAETLTDAQQTLLIDQAKYFNFQVDDIDAVQQKPKVMDAAMREAAYGLAETVDDDLSTVLVAGTASGNKIGSDGSPKLIGDDWFKQLVDLGTLLDDANVPKDDQRWCVVPNWFAGGLLKLSYFQLATPQGEDRIANGKLGKVAGFTIYQSNNITSSSTTYRVVAGHPMAFSYAEQISKVEGYRPQLRFADAVKGLLLYGRKVVRPTALAVLYCKNATT